MSEDISAGKTSPEASVDSNRPDLPATGSAKRRKVVRKARVNDGSDELFDGSDSRDYVNSFARGLDVIRSFSRSNPSMTLSEVAERTNMSRAAARRFLLTLVRDGYAETDGKHFRLSPKVLELGFCVLASMNVSEAMQPIMNELSEKLQESCFAAILDFDSVVYIARSSSARLVNVGISIGSRVPAHAVSSGRMLLASLSNAKLEDYLNSVNLKRFTPNTVTSKVQLRSAIADVRRQGWAMVDQELDVGLRSISVPVRDHAGVVVAALNVCCPDARVTVEDMRTRVLNELFEAAKRILLSLPG